MNAVTHAEANHPASKLRWLLKREFWEHKGGLFWAPIFTGAVVLGFVLMVITVGEVTLDRNNFNAGYLNLGLLTERAATPEVIEHIAQGTKVTLYLMSALFDFVTFWVLLFYCLGALYDDRRDRSVLFWKSLPLSDKSTVLSKALTAIVVGPLLSLTAAIVTGVAFMVLISIYVAFYGINPIPLLWSNLAVFKAVGTMLAILPIQALWSLPTVGWLLLVSAWARSKPFLWALVLPIGAGILVSWFDLMKSVTTMPDTWFWENVVARSLLSFFPGAWLETAGRGIVIDEPADLLQLIDLGNIYGTLATPEMLIGIVAGIAMIVGAVYFRRKRDEG